MYMHRFLFCFKVDEIFCHIQKACDIMKIMDGHDNKDDGARDGSAAQGIFSTPELTVDTEKITQQNNSAKEKNRVASIFANTDAGRQAQNINDAMVTSSAPATEDIVIRNEPKKRGKVLVIVAIVILLAAVGGGVGWLVINSLSNKGNSTITFDDVKTQFNKYSNYVLYGNEKDDSFPSDFEENYDYKINQQVVAQDSANEYWSRAEALITNVVDSYKQLENKNDQILSLLESQQKTLSFLRTYVSIGTPDDEALITMIENQGVDTGKEYIDSFYSDLSKQAQDITLTLTENRINQYKTLADILGLYSEKNCLSENEIDIECTESITDNQLNSLLVQYSALEHDADQLLSVTIQDFEKQIWIIHSQFDIDSSQGSASKEVG